MDHILEHEGQAVPDLSSVSASGSSSTQAHADDDEDDEDAEALKSLGVAGDAVEAKASTRSLAENAGSSFYQSSLSEHQMFPLWQNIQEHCPS